MKSNYLISASFLAEYRDVIHQQNAADLFRIEYNTLYNLIIRYEEKGQEINIADGLRWGQALKAHGFVEREMMSRDEIKQHPLITTKALTRRAGVSESKLHIKSEFTPEIKRQYGGVWTAMVRRIWRVEIPE